jgi:hypothetical protein
MAWWCVALYLTRGRVSHLTDSVSNNKSVVSMYNLHFTCYLMYVYTTYTRPLSVQAQYSRSCPIISSSCYNSSLITWTVVCLAAAKFKPLIFPVSEFLTPRLKSSLSLRTNLREAWPRRVSRYSSAVTGIFLLTFVAAGTRPSQQLPSKWTSASAAIPVLRLCLLSRCLANVHIRHSTYTK